MKLEFREFDIQGLKYKVNQEGVIINSDNNEIKQRITYDGYSVVTLGRNKRRKTYRVHRLVAMMFIPNSNNEDEVNHKDFNKQNNTVNNLEWVSHHNNILHAINGGKHISTRDLTGKNNPNYKNEKLKDLYRSNPELKKNLSRKGKQNGRAKQISVYKNEEFLKRFDYIGECCEWLVKNNYTNSQISGIRNRVSISIKNNKKYLGLIFKFEK